MKNLWSDKDSKNYNGDLALRVYTSRLLGQDSSLVLHGGGNTSCKSKVIDDFGVEQRILYIKGSGWDLATIENAGFAPAKLDGLLQMARFDNLPDAQMVSMMRQLLLDPASPNPSVEAILHAIIPFTFVDHTHTDAMVTISNTPDGISKIQLYILSTITRENHIIDKNNIDINNIKIDNDTLFAYLNGIKKAIDNATKNDYNKIVIVNGNVLYHAKFNQMLEYIYDNTDYDLIYLTTDKLYTKNELNYSPKNYKLLYDDIGILKNDSELSSHWNKYGHKEGRYCNIDIVNESKNEFYSGFIIHKDKYNIISDLIADQQIYNCSNIFNNSYINDINVCRPSLIIPNFTIQNQKKRLSQCTKHGWEYNMYK